MVGLAPLCGGCLGVYHPHRDLAADRMVAHSEQEVTREIHKKAREAWLMVRSEFPRKMFTPEFHDGFIEGYTDYLDRGGNGQPPAAPPLRYTQNKKYFSPEGHVLLRDYFLGFKYGTEVAVATGQRQFLTVPVLIAEKGEAIPTVPPAAVPPIPSLTGSDSPVPLVPQPLPPPRPMSKLPMPRTLPNGTVPPRNVIVEPPVDANATKFGPVPPRPLSPLPPTIPAIPMVPLLPESGAGLAVPVIQAGASEKVETELKLPEPPDEVPSLPPGVPTPPNTDDIPVLPVNHTVPPPLPANHPDPVKK